MPADWAAQRIKELSLGKAIVNALLPKRNQKDIASLIEEFQYPKYGPGMMWEVCRDKVEAQGSTVEMETKVTKVRHADGLAVEVTAETADGTERTFPAGHVISSMPISQLLQAMDPPVPAEVAKAAADLSFRDFLTVALIVPDDDIDWMDNWIYVHDPSVEVGRIQNFGSWSPYLVKEGRNVLGLEYFVFEGDRMWTSSDEDLIEQGKRELKALGLVEPSRVEGGYVVRMPKAYPTYDEHYQANVQVLRDWLVPPRPQRPPRRAQRHVPVQQPGPLHVHGHAHGGEHRHRRRPRHLGGQRGGGVPRDPLGDLHLPHRQPQGHRPRRPGDRPGRDRQGQGRPGRHRVLNRVTPPEVAVALR